MTLISHDERLIKALAVAIVDHPRATLKELAEAAGVSKATLHRFCGTRDNLVQMLEGHGETVLNQIIQACDLEHAEPLEALQRLIKEHLTHRELLVFLVFQYRPDFLDPHGEGAPLVAAWHGPIRMPSTSAARRPARHTGRSVVTGPATKCLDSRKGP